MARPALWSAFALMAMAAAGSARAEGDVAHGEQVFALCSGCHVLSGESYAGPALAGVVGRRAGIAHGFEYSKAMQSSGIVWSEQALDRFLADPGKAVPGTSMPISVPDAKDRADVIAYLKSVPAAP